MANADEVQAHLAAIVASSDDAIISKDLNGVVRSWNIGAERIFGYTSDEMVGQPITTIIPPERIDEEPSILERIRSGKRVDHFETVRMRKDGKRVDISVTISPIRDSTGKIIGASKIARDVTELRRSIRERERLYDLAKRMAGELDVHALVQMITDTATELCGAAFGAFFYNVADNAGGSYMLYTLSGVPREKFDKFPMPRNTEVFGATFSGEGIVRSDDITKDPRYGKNSPYHGMPSGHLPVRSYLAVPVIGRGRGVIGGLFFGHADVGVFNEQAEKVVAAIAGNASVALENAMLQREKEELLGAERAARAEAERVSRTKDEFLATLSHELRTPLNAILGWSQLIQRSKGDPETLTEGLNVIERNARVQTQLIEDLLDMSRIISGKVRLDVQRVEPGAVIEAALASVQPAAEGKGIRLLKILDPSAGPIAGDPNRLQQVIWNLLNNAIKFTPKGGRVDVLLERVNSHIEITVTDTGQGIKPEFLPHVFDRFRQADASTTRRHGGLGLGLAIVKHLVELHGGTVSVKSAGEGQGATFSLKLPVLATKHNNTEREHPAAVAFNVVKDCEQVGLQGLKVLIVDDEPDARELLRRLLVDCHANVLLADSAEKAMSVVLEQRPDILISDIGMPGKDGYELIREIRRLPVEKGGKLPAIALTAFARSEDRMKALMAGYQAHVAKPVEPQELIITVASVSGRVGG